MGFHGTGAAGTITDGRTMPADENAGGKNEEPSETPVTHIPVAASTQPQ